MAILSNISQKYKTAKADSNDICNNIDAYIATVDATLANEQEFIDVALVDTVKSECERFFDQINKLPMFTFLLNSKLITKKNTLETYLDNIKGWITAHNDVLAIRLIKKGREIIGKVEGRELDEQQMKCIVKPMRNHLVIAGAGTGKTTTIVGRVKYLLNSGMCKPENILVLSFTNASASEMGERINKETNQMIVASTFHKMGLDVIKAVEGIAPKITQISLPKFVQTQLVENTKNSKYLSFLCQYILFKPEFDKSEFDFQLQSEYNEYLRSNPPVTLKGDKVKSYGEMDIANFLFQNGIAYEYEKEYEVDTRTEDRFQYYPDFYLTDYGIYIEYFGINVNGEVPPYFTSREGRSPSEEYREGMKWKRKLHKDNDTVLIECFAYERSQGELLDKLGDKLKKAGVELNELPPEKVWEKVVENNSKNLISGIAELIATIISLMKSNEYSIDQVRQMCLAASGKLRKPVLVEVIEPIYDAYVNALEENGEIDFNDMINKAAHMISDGKYTNPYKYVIVDEYQDISKSRYNLLKALRDSADYNLFCVGDDWQSIYRFTGSDMDYILNFEKYWGATEYSKIETTYRFTDSLIDISGKFIMQNPSQIKKSIKGVHSGLGFAMGEIKGYREELAIRFMLNKLRELPMNSSVFFIGRYNFDSRMLSDCPELRCRYDVPTQTAIVELPDRPDLNMSFITAHKSKGLQADYVFIINNKEGGMGFPSRIQNDPIVDSMLGMKEEFPFAEERRLFYVALTRAKVKTYLIVVDGIESVFASEMEKRYEKEMKREAFTCPLCGGRLEKKTGPYGDFYGCINYSITGCEFKRKIYKRQ